MTTTYIEKPTVFDKFEADDDALIEASAGTGKTYTLEHLVVYHVLDEVPVEEILVVTFTNRAAGELKARVRGRLEESLRKFHQPESDTETQDWEIDERKAGLLEQALNDLERATMTTLHGFCEEVLQTYGVELGTELEPKHVDEDELVEEALWDVLRSNFTSGRNRRLLQDWLEEHTLSELHADLASIYTRQAVVAPDVDEPTLDAPMDGGVPGERLADLEMWQRRTAVRQKFAPLLEREVERRKRVEGVLTFRDMIEQVERAVSQGGDIVDRLRDVYSHALVDEFQDTSPSQWKIFRKVFYESDQHTLTIIGDPKQSIYGFRRADLATYRKAKEDFQGEEESNKAPLKVNHRSTQEFMDAVNPLFGGDEESDALLSDQDHDYPAVDAATDLGDEWPETPVRLFTYEEDDDDGAHPSADDLPDALFSDTVDEIDRLLNEASPTITVDGDERELEAGDIYVLTRSHWEADNIGAGLRDRGIPHGFYKKGGLFETDEAEDVRRLLRAAADPDDRAARRKAMLSPFFDISLADLEDYDVRDPDRRTARTLLIQWHRVARHGDVDTMFERILQESGVVERELLKPGGPRRLTNYRHLFDWLTRKAATLKVGLGPLAEHLREHMQGHVSTEDEDEDTQRVSTDRSAVQILTMHSAKGLSAEVVFVAGGYLGWKAGGNRVNLHRPSPEMAEKFPSISNDGNDAIRRPNVAYDKEAGGELATALLADNRAFEERETARLLYVAITRAKRRVYLPWVIDGDRDVMLDPLFDAITHVRDEHGGVFDRLYDAAPHCVDWGGSSASESGGDFQLPDAARDILRKRPPNGVAGTSFADLRDRTRSVESYSSLTGGSTTDKTFVADDRADDEATLPPSRRSGDALHEVLEEMDYTEVVDTASFEEWWTETAVDELVREKLEEHDLTPEDYAEHAGRILYDALRADIEPRDGESFPPISPLGALERDQTRREVSFHLPTPEEVHPSLDRLEERTGPLAVERGYLRGYIDLVFEHDGRLYFADWKGNSRMEEGDYSPSAIETNVRENYDLQAGLYTLAVCRLAGITDREAYERMGGLFYFYLRGLRPDRPGHGYYFRRPDWSEICNLEERVRRAGRETGHDDELKHALKLQPA